MVSYEVYSKIRDKRELTDYEVAKRAAIVPSTFSDWKSGRSVPKVEKLIGIAKVLEVPIDRLIGAE